MILIGERVTRPDERGTWGDWAVIALLAIGAANAKVTILPLLLLALFPYVGWSLLRTGRIPRAAISAAVLMMAVGGIYYVLLWAGHGSGLGLDPFRTFEQMPVPGVISEYLLGVGSDFPLKAALLDVGVVACGAVGLFAAQLAGLAWLARRRGRELSAELMWLLSMLAVGLAVIVAVGAPGSGNQVYFIFLATLPGCLLSAVGLRSAWAARPELGRRSGRLIGIGLAWLAMLALLIAAPGALDLFAGPSEAPRSLIFLYAGLAASMVLLYLAARRWIGPSRWPAAALCTGAVILVGALSAPFGYLVPAVDPAEAQPVRRILTPDLYRAMLFLRENTSADAVFAVNDDDLANFNYSAFSERRAFIEGWLYSQTSVDAGFGAVSTGEVSPFADRLELNRRALAEADPEALRVLREDYGVRYLIIDDVNGYPAAREKLTRLYETVYDQPGILILDMSSGG